MAPYERDSILEQCGISSKLAPSQKVDTRVIMAPPATRLHGEESCTLNLNNFDGEALAKVFRERPSEVSNRRCLRILQYVNAIGSACILSSLNAAFDKLPKGNAVQAVDEPVLEKLFHIHLRLVNLEGQDHLFIARHRYIKYCYFETGKSSRAAEGFSTEADRKLQIRASRGTTSNTPHRCNRSDLPRF